MDTVVSHFVIHDPDGGPTVYEVEYTVSPHREGVLCFAKVPSSERPCTCQEWEAMGGRAAGAPG